jgi:hypothetical protein
MVMINIIRQHDWRFFENRLYGLREDGCTPHSKLPTQLKTKAGESGTIRRPGVALSYRSETAV